MTPSIVKIYRAGRVRRWHANADLADTDDRIDGHSARVARLLMALFDDCPAILLRAALTHDDGEVAVGDIPAPVKRRHPRLEAMVAEIEGTEVHYLWGADALAGLDEIHARQLRFADRLDAFMWAAHHRPWILENYDWPEARRWLWKEAGALGAPLDVIDYALSMGDGR